MLKLLTNESSSEIDLVSLSLDEIARLGAKKLLTQALALEVNEYIERNSALRDDEGLRQVVRNGRAKERKITTGSGTIAVRAPRAADRRVGHSFCSRILPPYLRRDEHRFMMRKMRKWEPVQLRFCACKMKTISIM